MNIADVLAVVVAILTLLGLQKWFEEHKAPAVIVAVLVAGIGIWYGFYRFRHQSASETVVDTARATQAPSAGRAERGATVSAPPGQARPEGPSQLPGVSQVPTSVNRPTVPQPAPEARSTSIVLTRARPSGSARGFVTAPGSPRFNFSLIEIDASDFPNGGKLVLNASVGEGSAALTFDLFPGVGPHPLNEDGALARQINVSPNAVMPKIEHLFERGTVFRFGATGSWGSSEGLTNSFRFTARVDAF